MSEYGVLRFENIEAEDVFVGDVLYVPTENGSSYILDVQSIGDYKLDGVMSRRGSTVITSSGVTGNFDDIQAGFGHLKNGLSVGHRTRLFFNQEPFGGLDTSNVVNGLQIIRREQ